jgi:TBC1 domain family member 14
MDEVESLMQFLKISGIGADQFKIPDDISFRPKNLNPKTKEEQEKHRRLIEENRTMYIQKLKKKEKEIKDRRIKEREREERESELKLIWEKEILPNWSQIKDTKKVISLWREGIPSSVRGSVWILSLGNQSFITQDLFIINIKKAKKLRELQNMQSSLNLKINEMKSKGASENDIMQVEHESKKLQERLRDTNSPENKEHSIEGIQIDLPRTFPELGFFKQGSEFNMDCEEILGAFALSRPDIGYVQGMSYIAGMLILNMDKFKAFVCLNKIITSWTLFCFFKADNPQMNRRFQLFRNILHHNCPMICEHIEDEGITAQMYLLEWFMTLFVKSLNIDVSSRVWDLFILEGEIVLFRVAVALLKMIEADILHGTFEDIINAIKSVGTKVKESESLIKEIYNIEIPQWVIEEVPKIINECIPK